jgi:hypothetical protein
MPELTITDARTRTTAGSERDEQGWLMELDRRGADLLFRCHRAGGEGHRGPWLPVGAGGLARSHGATQHSPRQSRLQLTQRR